MYQRTREEYERRFAYLAQALTTDQNTEEALYAARTRQSPCSLVSLRRIVPCVSVAVGNTS